MTGTDQRGAERLDVRADEEHAPAVNSRTLMNVQRVVDDARTVGERLLRVTLALATSESVIAATFDRMASRGGPQAIGYRLQAKRARASAEECQAFADRLRTIYGTDPDDVRLDA